MIEVLPLLFVAVFGSFGTNECEIEFETKEVWNIASDEITWLYDTFAFPCPENKLLIKQERLFSIWALTTIEKGHTSITLNGLLYKRQPIGNQRSIMLHEMIHVFQLSKPRVNPPLCAKMREEYEAYNAEISYAHLTQVSEEMLLEIKFLMQDLRGKISLVCLGVYHD